MHGKLAHEGVNLHDWIHRILRWLLVLVLAA